MPLCTFGQRAGRSGARRGSGLTAASRTLLLVGAIRGCARLVAAAAVEAGAGTAGLTSAIVSGGVGYGAGQPGVGT